MQKVFHADGRRPESGPLTGHRDGFAQALREMGYCRKTIDTYLWGVSRFGQWLGARNISAPEVDQRIVEEFVAEIGRYQPPSCLVPRLPDTACAARRLSEYFWAEKISEKRSAVPLASQLDGWLGEFDRYLSHVKGLSRSTRLDYAYYAQKLALRRQPTAGLDWSTLRAEEISDFVCVEAQRLKCGGRRRVATATRALLGYLVFSGCIGEHLDGAVPILRRFKDASLPEYLSRQEIQRVLGCCDVSTVLGQRDRVILLILAQWGLRAGEVAGLKLDDFDWGNASVLIRAAKTGRQRRLPISQEVGTAIASYLRHGRPRLRERNVFVRTRAPIRPLTPGAISAVASRALRKATVHLARSGAHAFRHTVASHLVQGGASFKEIADILGHARIETTAIYAKVDVDKLAEVALPWPGGA